LWVHQALLPPDLHHSRSKVSKSAGSMALR
jgi:hypothetical protein